MRRNRVVLAALIVLLVAGAATAGTRTAAPVAGKIVFSRAEARHVQPLDDRAGDPNAPAGHASLRLGLVPGLVTGRPADRLRARV